MAEPGEQIIRLEGTFDETAALRLREQVATEKVRRAILDFSHIEYFEDSTLPLLTINLVLMLRRGCAVFLVGLREHQLRMLHHFGVELAADGSVQTDTPHETRFSR